MKEDILKLLQREIIPTIGSVELANVALCTAYATSTVGGWAQEIDLEVSPEIMNRGKSDRIPELNRSGLEYAAALGTLLLNPDRRCLLMAETTDEAVAKATRPEVKQHTHVSVRWNCSPWFVRARVYTDWGIGTAEILDYPGDIVLLQIAAKKVWQKEPEQQDQEVYQKKLVAELTEEQLDALVAECSEKELFFLKPGVSISCLSIKPIFWISSSFLCHRVENGFRYFHSVSSPH